MSVVTATILSDGATMDAAFELVSIDILRQVKRIPEAEIELVDGEASQNEFSISNSPFFEPGKGIEIKLRYEDGTGDHSVFKGVITRQSVVSTGQGSMLRVGMRDATIRLSGGRHSATFRDLADHEVISQLVQDAGLDAGTITATEPKHAELVQFDCTDWDFMLSRAEIQGLWVVAADGIVSAQPPVLTAEAKETFVWGSSKIYDFDMEADAGRQFSAIESVGWDLKGHKATAPSQGKTVKAEQGNLDGGTIATALGFDSSILRHLVPIDAKELAAWADARLMQGRLSLLQGRISTPGSPTLSLLDVVEIGGVGERWNGKTLVTGIRHRVDQNGWLTDIFFGLPDEWFCQQSDILAAPASGLLPAATGLQIGVVAEFEEDPEKEFRLRVLLPAIGEKPESAVWARLAAPDAGKARGFFFRPAKGDEVVVGFLGQDPRHAVVLGSLFGSKNAPPDVFSKLSADNVDKGLVTAGGTTLAFMDAEKASVYIETKAKNRVVIDDEAQAIELADQHGNTVTLNKEGIELKSVADIKINASDGTVTIVGKVDMK